MHITQLARPPRRAPQLRFRGVWAGRACLSNSYAIQPTRLIIAIRQIMETNTGRRDGYPAVALAVALAVAAARLDAT